MTTLTITIVTDNGFDDNNGDDVARLSVYGVGWKFTIVCSVMLWSMVSVVGCPTIWSSGFEAMIILTVCRTDNHNAVMRSSWLLYN